MFFNRSKPKNKALKSFYIGNVPTRPGRQQINLDNPITNNDNKILNPRIGEFNTTSGYHPVRPAIIISNESKNKSSQIEPYNTNQKIPDLSNQTHHNFLRRKRKA